MSAAVVFDLGLRLRASAEGTVQPRLSAPVVSPCGPLIAVHVQGRHTVTVHRAGQAATTAPGLDGIAQLAPWVPTADSEPPCLVVADRSQLDKLRTIAQQLHPDHEHFHVGALIEWWTERSHHPGARSIVCITDACRQRWVTGEAPASESDLDVWRRWLRVDAENTDALLGMVRLLSTGATPSWARTDDDEFSWKRLATAVANQRDWRLRDGIARASAGFRARCDSADRFARNLLDDPTWAQRERFSGTVVDARVIEQWPVVASTTQTSCRHRPGSDVELEVVVDGISQFRSATVAAISVAEDQTLHLTLDVAGEGGLVSLPVGATMTVRPAAPDEGMMLRGRAMLSDRYRRSSWLRPPDGAAPLGRLERPVAAPEVAP